MATSCLTSAIHTLQIPLGPSEGAKRLYQMRVAQKTVLLDSPSALVSVSLAVLRALKGKEGCLFKTPRRVSAPVNTLKPTAGLDN